MNFILWLQNAIHLNLSFQQTQNGGIHTYWCFTNAWKSKRWLCGIIFYKSIILKLLHSSAPEERKTNWGEKIKEKFFLLQQAQCASCCHYLPNLWLHFFVFETMFISILFSFPWKYQMNISIWLGFAIY